MGAQARRILELLLLGSKSTTARRRMSQITETEDFMLATNSSSQIDTMSAEAIIQKVLSENPGRPCITCSFQVEGMIVLNILRRQLPDIPVLFLDTGYHFAETYSYRDRMTAAWNLNLQNLTPKRSVAEQEAEIGVLNRTDPGRCCHLRKVDPLFEALENYDIWFTGLRREQASTRKNLRIIEHHALSSGKVLVKASPLAAWTWEQVWKRTKEERIPYLALYDEGYRSIGCEPCTAVPTDPNNPRSGRWDGQKLECGIHTLSERSQ